MSEFAAFGRLWQPGATYYHCTGPSNCDRLTDGARLPASLARHQGVVHLIFGPPLSALDRQDQETEGSSDRWPRAVAWYKSAGNSARVSDRPGAHDKGGHSQMGMRMLRRALLISAAMTMLFETSAAISQASTAGSHLSGSSLKLSGPKTNKYGTDFDYTISGTAAGPANYLVAWEQYYPQKGCATTYAAESTRAFLPSTYGLTLWLNRAVSTSYSARAAFGAAHLGKHGMCAYLINLTTGDTYAYGGAFWTNVK